MPSSSQPNVNQRPCPYYTITHNGESDGEYGKHDMDSSWLVVFVRYAVPVSSFSSNVRDLLAIKSTDPMIIESDCIACTIVNSKSSFAKQCTLQMKSGDVYYPYAVAPGDWCIVWMLNDQVQINALVDTLRGNGQKDLNDFDSGLKFAGRVLGCGAVDEVADGGVRTISQTVSCQAFLELSTSIYFTDAAKLALFPVTAPAAGGASPVADPNAQMAYEQNIRANFAAKYNLKYGGLMTNYLTLFDQKAQTAGLSPDTVISAMVLMTLGIDPSITNEFNSPQNSLVVKGTFNDAIAVPQKVAKILGSPAATKLYELYSFYFGVQKYANSANRTPWNYFTPKVAESGNGAESSFNFCTNKLEGKIFFHPPLWSNRTIWSIWNDYLNPVVNEMYTCMKVVPSDTGKGIISPTVVVREIPLSTSLYSHLVNRDIQIKNKSDHTLNNDPTLKTGIDLINQEARTKTRTFFAELPRWVIDESMVISVNTTTDENDRVNFVQVWGTGGNELSGSVTSDASATIIDGIKIDQLNLGNWFVDEKDIQRNGLRMDTTESQFDFVLGSKNSRTRTPIWARMRADWLFNGQLKPKGTIVLVGVNEPICEGDNCEVRGVVYHINQVQHQGAIVGSNKRFRTTLSVSNGILAKSLLSTTSTRMPMYPNTQGGRIDSVDHPGLTGIEQSKHPNRDASGESISSGGTPDNTSNASKVK
jgi:hypothetical protein